VPEPGAGVRGGVHPRQSKEDAVKKTMRTIAVPLFAVLATAGAALAASAPAHAAAAPAAVSPNVGCVGVEYALSPSSTLNDEEYFWWTQFDSSHICIGQVDVAESYTTSTGLLERVRVWSTSGGLLYEGFSGGTISNGSITFVHHVNEIFNHGRVQVCTAVVYNDTNRDVDSAVPILCDTVG
jgi:hypothetical protein